MPKSLPFSLPLTVKSETNDQIAKITEENKSTITEALEEMMNAYNYKRTIFKSIPQLFDKLDNEFVELERCAKNSQIPDEKKQDINEEINEEIKSICTSIKEILVNNDSVLRESVNEGISKVIPKVNKAIEEDDQNKLQEVLQNIHERNLLYYSPAKYDVLFNAIRNNRIGIIKILLAKESRLDLDVNYTKYFEISNQRGIYEHNALSLALIDLENTDLSEILIEKFGADLNLFLKRGKDEFNVGGNKKNYSKEVTVLASAVDKLADPLNKNEKEDIKKILKYTLLKTLKKNNISDISDIGNVARYTYYGKFVQAYNFEQYLEQFNTEIQDEVKK